MQIFMATGNLCKENELKILPSGKEVLNNTLAVRRDYKNQDGEYEADFIPLVIFGATAKYINDYATKGSKIEIIGRWQHRSYMNQKGEIRYVDECIVEKASLVYAPRTENKQAAQEQYQESKQSNPFADDYKDDDYEDDDLPF